MVRQLLFVLFGVGVGAAYAGLFSWLIFPSVAAAVLLTGFGGVVGWMCGRIYGRATDRAIDPRTRHDAMTVTAFAILVFPVVVALFLVSFAYVAAAMASMMCWAAIDGTVAERGIRRRLKAQGRLANLRELRPKLEAGEGVLIAETGNKGAYRLWWTADDLLALGEPVKDGDELIEVLNGDKEHPFNERCLTEYLDERAGKAVLVPTSALRAGTLDRIKRGFPRMRVVTVVRPGPWVEQREDGGGDGSAERGA